MADLVKLDKYLKNGVYRIPNNPKYREALKNQVILPALIKTGRALYRNNGNLSNSREGLPEVYIGGRRQNLSSVSNWVREQINPTGKKVKKPSFSDVESTNITKSTRRGALEGFSSLGRKQADFYNTIENLRTKRDKDLLTASPSKTRKINDQFDKNMAKLFHNNRRWLPKVNNRPIQYNAAEADSYGWPKGLSEQGYLNWQRQTYKDAGGEAKGFFAEHGIEMHAGHAFSAGGLKVTPEMLAKLDIPTQQLIRADGEPDGDGNFIIKGTNSVSNLAIEVAKKNLSHGKDITRTIKDLIELNVAFTKTGSLQEYLNTGDFNYRKSEDFHRVTRSFLNHSLEDINAITAQGENELLLKGPPESKIMATDTYKSSDGKILTRPLNPTTQTSDGLLKTEVHNKAGNVLSSRVDYDEQMMQESERIIRETNAPITAVQDFAETGLEWSLNAFGSTVGKPDLGSNVFRVADVVKSLNDEDYIGAGLGSLHLLRQESIHKMPNKPWTSKNYFLPPS